MGRAERPVVAGTDATKERLDGGRTSAPVRIGDAVHRPARPWTHAVLRHLEAARADAGRGPARHLLRRAGGLGRSPRNWNRLFRESVAGNHQAAIPDGQLCSAGRTEGGRYAAVDTVGAWRATSVATSFGLGRPGGRVPPAAVSSAGC